MATFVEAVELEYFDGHLCDKIIWGSSKWPATIRSLILVHLYGRKNLKYKEIFLNDSLPLKWGIVENLNNFANTKQASKLLYP
jgi:hypothetical protein